MKRTLICLSIVLVATSLWPHVYALEVQSLPVETTPVVPVPSPQSKPQVQLALLLDTSNSMDGLIDQARTQLWSIVNEFIFAKRNGAAPEIQVALYEYGNSGLSQTQGYIRQVVPFTTDLDQVSQSLFALTTNGGDEYCGWVIQEAIQQLTWSSDPHTLKTVFIAGNEAFTQGPIDYRNSCKTAIEKGILINTIHCGAEGAGRNGQWHQGALLADGRFLNINQDQAIVHIEAPQDAEINTLNIQLNKTYLAYGREGTRRREMQVDQDNNAAQLSPESQVQRVIAKSSANYHNAHWDVVDAVKEQKIKLEALEAEQLPEEMRSMSDQEQKAYVAAKTKERETIQQKIQRLNEQRRAFIAQEKQKLTSQDESLGSAIIQAVKTQAMKKGFIFTNSQEKPGTNPTSAESK
ncbi:VWA domain-containing protein [Planctomycetota bacterium]